MAHPRASEIIKGLYIITDSSGARGHEELTRQAIAGGAKLIQFRDKHLPKEEFLDIAKSLRKITSDSGAAFIVNDDLETALACGADGVHLGQDDMPLADARRIAGDRLIIGISTHSLGEALAAQEEGADYIGFGPVFSTATKDAGPVQGIEALRAVREKIKIPIAAIGGINSDNLSDIIMAGADAAAVISAVSCAQAPALAARKLIEIFNGRS